MTLDLAQACVVVSSRFFLSEMYSYPGWDTVDDERRCREKRREPGRIGRVRVESARVMKCAGETGDL
jgi:hypothetical protein